MPYNFVPDSFHTGVTTEALRAKIERKSGALPTDIQIIQNAPVVVILF